MKPSDADVQRAEKFVVEWGMFCVESGVDLMGSDITKAKKQLAIMLADARADGIREAAAITVPLTYSTMVEHAILALLDDKKETTK